MIPYHCGTLWEDEQRTTSFLFRKLRRFWDPTKLDLREAAELVALTRLLGNPKLLIYLFGWKTTHRISRVTQLINHPPVAAAADAYENENLAHWDDETGRVLLTRLIAGGWRRGYPPPICRDYLRSRSKAGVSYRKLADEYGISATRMYRWLNGPRKRPENRRSRAIASLVIG